MQPLINILIRTSQRPILFQRCLQSIMQQTYKNIRVIVSYDFDCDYIPDWCDKIRVQKGDSGYYWNLYLNELKERVNEGWFIIIDDDDFIYSKSAIADIVKHLTNPEVGIICQFLRGQMRKPGLVQMRNKTIKRGLIGMPCIILHHSKKNIAMFDGLPAADYRFISDVSKVLPLEWVEKVIVKTDRIGKGKPHNVTHNLTIR